MPEVLSSVEKSVQLPTSRRIAIGSHNCRKPSTPTQKAPNIASQGRNEKKKRVQKGGVTGKGALIRYTKLIIIVNVTERGKSAELDGITHWGILVERNGPGSG